MYWVVPCGGLQLLRKYQNIDQITRFLRGLSDSFSTVRSQIMLIQPLPEINQVFFLVIQQERELNSVVNSLLNLLCFSTNLSLFLDTEEEEELVEEEEDLTGSQFVLFVVYKDT